MKHPGAILWLSEIDEVFHPKVHHLLYVHLIPFMDTLQQAVDLKDMQAAFCYPYIHCGTGARKQEKLIFVSINCTGKVSLYCQISTQVLLVMPLNLLSLQNNLLYH